MTAPLVKRLHPGITGRSTDLLLPSAHDFLQLGAAAAILKNKRGWDQTVTGRAAAGHILKMAQVKVFCVSLLLPLEGKAKAALRISDASGLH